MTASADELVAHAVRQIQAGTRLDMSEIATRFGIGRTTLFRRVGNREDLMGRALWSLAHGTLEWAEARWAAEHGTAFRDEQGGLRSVRILEYFGAAIAADKGFGQLLTNEPAVAIRVLTDPNGRVQPRVVADYVALLERDLADGQLTSMVDPRTLGYAVIRLAESIIYADALAGLASTAPTALALVRKLVEGVIQPAHPPKALAGS